CPAFDAGIATEKKVEGHLAQQIPGPGLRRRGLSDAAHSGHQYACAASGRGRRDAFDGLPPGRMNNRSLSATLVNCQIDAAPWCRELLAQIGEFLPRPGVEDRRMIEGNHDVSRFDLTPNGGDLNRSLNAG